MTKDHFEDISSYSAVLRTQLDQGDRSLSALATLLTLDDIVELLWRRLRAETGLPLDGSIELEVQNRDGSCADVVALHAWAARAFAADRSGQQRAVPTDRDQQKAGRVQRVIIRTDEPEEPNGVRDSDPVRFVTVNTPCYPELFLNVWLPAAQAEG